MLTIRRATVPRLGRNGRWPAGAVLARLMSASILLAGLIGCTGSGCEFVADMAPPGPTTQAERTPRQALRAWLQTEDVGAPAAGWRRGKDAGNLRIVRFRNDDWTLEAVRLPEGGYFVGSVACTSQRG